MEPPNPYRGQAPVPPPHPPPHSLGRALHRSPSQMANAPSTMLHSGGGNAPQAPFGVMSPPFALQRGSAEFKSAAHELSTPPRAPPQLPPTSPSREGVVRQLVAHLSTSMNDSLVKIAEQYGVTDAVALVARASGTTTNAPEDARVLVQELQRAKRNERELQLLVEDLQTEQRVAKERLALYSILALKLKRELINEKLAHIDSKKEVEEVRTQYEGGGSGSTSGAALSTESSQPKSPETASSSHQQGTSRRGSYEVDVSSARGQANRNDPWTSPDKTSGESSLTPGAPSGSRNLQMSFGSFYSSRQPTSQEEDEDDDEAGGRNSLMDQFLPSTLLDSPQLTPRTRSVTDEQPEDNQDVDVDETEDKEHAVGRELERELASFALSPTRSPASKDACDCCGHPQAPVVEVADCGHRLCRSCERTLLESSEPRSDQQCPRCKKAIISLRLLGDFTVQRDDDNQVGHLRTEPTSRPSSSDSTATATSTMATTFTTPSSIAPLTLSLLSEMFENIPTDELEEYLRDAGGQVSGAIERLLQRHPSFNPALAAEVSVMAGPGAGGSKSSAASLHRSTSSTISSSQQQAQTAGGGSVAGGSNWKTEMCMYYLQGKCNKTRRTCSFAHGESDLMRTTSAKHTSSTNYKSRMCPQWLEGSCSKSRRECPLAHGENDLRDGLALLGQNAASSSGGVGSGSSSAIAPPALPTSAPRLQNYKTELCYYYLKGCCNFTKEECRFAHGESDLRTVESNTLEWSSHTGGGNPAFMADPYTTVSGASASTDKASMQQHQFQQQYLAQFQPPMQPQQQTMAQHPSFGLGAHQPPFVPQAHQFHQMAPPSMHPHQLQGQHQINAPYGAPAAPGGVQPQHPPYRYMKSMDDAKQPPRRPLPPRREATWSQSNYDSMGSDF